MATAHIIDLKRPGEWQNYHNTGTSHLKGRFALRSGDAGRGRTDIGEAAGEVHAWLQEAKRQQIPVRPVGGAWSLSNIQLVQNGWMLNTRRFNRCFKLATADFASPDVDTRAFMLVEGGVQVDGDGKFVVGTTFSAALDSSNHYRVNFDKGQQSESGSEVSVAGNIANGTSSCSETAPSPVVM
mgnify:CR=1 FL=1